jgi:hypothetical protein
LVFLIWFFFRPRLWDTLCASVCAAGAAGRALPVPSLGHLLLGPARQETTGDPVHIDAAGTALAGDQPGLGKLGKVGPGGALTDASMQRKRPDGRKASPSMVGEADEALHRPSETRLQWAVEIKGDGDEWEQKSLLQVQQHPPGSS